MDISIILSDETSKLVILYFAVLITSFLKK